MAPSGGRLRASCGCRRDGLSCEMSVLLALCTGVGVLGGQLYAAGGHDGPLVRKTVEVFDPQTNSWRLVCDMNMCRRNAGQIVPPTPRVKKTDLSMTVHCILIIQRKHSNLTSLLPPGVCAINGLLYVIGGDDGSCNLSSVEFYNPATDKWSLIPTNMSNGRSYAGHYHFFLLSSFFFCELDVFLLSLQNRSSIHFLYGCLCCIVQFITKKCPQE